MTLNQKKITAFGVFFIFFVIQVYFSINALMKLHVSHHVIEEEWKEFNRVQALEDLLDEQNASLIVMFDGKNVQPPIQSSKHLNDIADILDDLDKDYQSHKILSRTEHEQVEDAYLINIVGPLRSYLKEYSMANFRGRLRVPMAKEFAKRLNDIRHQILLLRQSDAEFAQKALDVAKNARRQTLRNSLIISIILAIALMLWAIYFLINLNRQTRLEIYQQKIMTAGLLAQSLAHEIRNPLGIIIGAGDLLAQRQSLDQESRELAGYMVEEVKRIDSLINELLSLSRKKSESKEKVDIGLIIRSVLELTGGKMKQSGITVNFTHKAAGVFCSCVPGQVRQVVLNLLLNAIDVSSSHDTIEITTEKKDNYYVLTIRDYGKGFPMKDKEKIFDLFYTTKESGFGIGLAVVKRIVDEHGGSIQVYSWPKEGAMFTVSFPLGA